MWVSIRARKMKLSAARREKIEQYVVRVLRRERWQVASAVLYVAPARPSDGAAAFAARIVLWSPALGQIACSDVDASLRRSVSGALLRVREVVRRRLQKLQSRRRRLTRNRVRRFFAIHESRGEPSSPAEGARP